MCAMLEIDRNARLKELGWKLLLQVSILFLFDMLLFIACFIVMLLAVYKWNHV
jgi:hypothetical protein